MVMVTVGGGWEITSDSSNPMNCRLPAPLSKEWGKQQLLYFLKMLCCLISLHFIDNGLFIDTPKYE